MINFIICDDEKAHVQKNTKIIDKVMMHYNLDYKSYVFFDYDANFTKIVSTNMDIKVYLLDIEMNENSGLDAARLIREINDDWTSFIIFITNHSKYKFEALGNRLYLMDFINKNKHWEEELTEDIERIIKSINNNTNYLSFEFNHVLKRIELKNITHIEKKKNSKNCIINTIYESTEIKANINELLAKLDNNFIKTSRSTIINLTRVTSYNKVTNELTFQNGTTTSDISRLYKKEVIKNVKPNI